MKCSDVRTLFSQINDHSVTMQVQQNDMDFLSTNGYVSYMPQEEYNEALADVSKLDQMNADLQNEMNQERNDALAYEEEQRKVHSISFHFEGGDKKQAELAKIQSENDALQKEEADISQKDAALAALIQKKSTLDRMVAYGSAYLALTGLGVITLNDLNVRNYRVSDDDFSNYVQESRNIMGELRAIADRANSYVSSLKTTFQKVEISQLWSVAIGLAKLQGDENQILQAFVEAMKLVEHFDSTIENKMMAAEIIASFKSGPAQSSETSDPQTLTKTLQSLDNQIRHDAKVPKQLSVGIAAMIMFAKRFDGTYPTDRFQEFTKLTRSYESAAILAVVTTPPDQLTPKFQSFRALFNSMGFQLSEDTELASAYLTISDLGPDDVRTKMSIIIDGLKNYLEYPLVCAAILTSIPTLEANETLDLLEKAYGLVASVAIGLDRPELLTLAVRMIHGIKNELVKELDPTAKVTATPVQFTYAPMGGFYFFFVPLIVANAAYHSTFSGIGGSHPAHTHGGGGFVG